MRVRCIQKGIRADEGGDTHALEVSLISSTGTAASFDDYDYNFLFLYGCSGYPTNSSGYRKKCS